jgi:hypothetical protein
MTKFNTKREADIARVIKYLKQILCVKKIKGYNQISRTLSSFKNVL